LKFSLFSDVDLVIPKDMDDATRRHLMFNARKVLKYNVLNKQVIPEFYSARCAREFDAIRREIKLEQFLDNPQVSKLLMELLKNNGKTSN
jgi:hypothetical protein